MLRLALENVPLGIYFVTRVASMNILTQAVNANMYILVSFAKLMVSLICPTKHGNVLIISLILILIHPFGFTIYLHLSFDWSVSTVRIFSKCILPM